MLYEGVMILYSGHHYERTLALARVGVLPFFWLACAMVYLWGTTYFDRVVAVFGVFLFTFLPPILGHGGLATTDMAVTAGMGAAFVTGYWWLEQPSVKNAIVFGAATALMIVCKFSALVYFPCAVAFSLAWYLYSERPTLASVTRAVRTRLPSLSLAVISTMVLVWSVYRFSFGAAGFGGLRLPAPEIYAGIRQVLQKNANGENIFLWGTHSSTGFWYFFPLALSIKTPLAFLVLVVVGGTIVLRKPAAFTRPWVPLAFALGILIPAMFSSINIGVRHVLPIYLGFSMLAAVALVRLLGKAQQRRWLRWGVPLLLLWFAGSSVLNHPDYLAYFNELVAGQPENFLADSDLDWGQDLKRLSSRLRELGATSVAFDSYIVGAWEQEHGFPKIHPVDRLRPTVGWTAISVGVLKQTDMVEWAQHIKPTERVGKSIFLWYFPPQR